MSLHGASPELAAYIREKRICEILNEVVEFVTSGRPDDPLKAMISRLEAIECEQASGKDSLIQPQPNVPSRKT